MSKFHSPGVSYHLFNNLLGLLKWIQESKKPFGLYIQAMIIPLLSDLVLSMNGLKFSDFKKERVDIFVSTNGQFWFRKGVSAIEFPEDMFPTGDTKFVTQDVFPSFGAADPVAIHFFSLYSVRVFLSVTRPGILELIFFFYLLFLAVEDQSSPVHDQIYTKTSIRNLSHQGHNIGWENRRAHN